MTLQFYNSLGFDGSNPDGSDGTNENTSDKLLRISNNLPKEYNNAEFIELPVINKYISVETQLPQWLVESNRNIDAFLTQILQNYYDWLYDSNTGSGYYLDDKFATIKDIEDIPPELVGYILSNYLAESSSLMDVYVLSSELKLGTVSLREGTVLIDRGDTGVEVMEHGLIINGNVRNTKDGGIYSAPTQSTQESVLVISDINSPYVNTKTNLSINSFGRIVDNSNTSVEDSLDSATTDTAPVEVEILPLVTTQSARRFMLNITEQFYNNKGTAKGISYFFNTLLGTESVEVVYDGKSSYELVLNWKNYTIPKHYYEDFYLTYVHPVGTAYTLNQQVSTDFPSRPALGGGDSGGNSGDIPQFSAWEELTYGDGAYDTTGTGQEISVIGNYFPYTLGDTGDIAVTAGCSGATVSGITNGATGNTYTNMITFAFPDWSTAVEIAGSTFGLINIYEFAHLDAASGSTSPNDGRVANYSCPVGGYT